MYHSSHITPVLSFALQDVQALIHTTTLPKLDHAFPNVSCNLFCDAFHNLIYYSN